MQVEIKVWREGKNILVRNDKFHINTFGKNLEDALEHFREAFLMVMEDHKEISEKEKSTDLTLILPYPIEELKKELEQA